MPYLVPTTQRTVTSCMAEVSAALDVIRTSLGDIDITLSGNVVSTLRALPGNKGVFLSHIHMYTVYLSDGVVLLTELPNWLRIKRYSSDS